MFWAFMLIAGAILWYLLVQKAYSDSVSQNQTHNGEAAPTLEEAQPQWPRPGEAIARPEQPLMRQQEGSRLETAQPEIGGLEQIELNLSIPMLISPQWKDWLA